MFLDDVDEPADSVPGGPTRLALRRAVDRALVAPVACPDCGRTMACPCGRARHEGRVEAILAAVAPWLQSEAA
ncbi:hypothetical protein ACFVTT_15770 [Streptomyces niveus]|uniref:hypothetical protein n=1 Tax=Streptomyces niveus TaxID=193462 RepID=UPI00343D7474